MKAIVFRGSGVPLDLADVADPLPGPGQVRLQVHSCGVCRTDLHIVDGELGAPKLPLVLGHQIVGTILELGDGVSRFEDGERVGVPWLGWTCGECRYCDGEAFMALAPQVPVQTEVTAFPLVEAEQALALLRSGTARGAVALSTHL